MSYSLKYYPDPGIAYDISKMLFVKLNPESVWKDFLTSIESQTDEINFINTQANLFPAVDPELLLFAYKPSYKTEIFISRIIETLIHKNFIKFSINSLFSYLQNSTQIQKDLYTYYFGDQNFTFENLERMIRSNKYIPDRIKLLLFSFILNPSKYIVSLTNIIEKYYSFITTTYISQAAQISIPCSFINSIMENTYSLESLQNNNNQSYPIYYSLCFTIRDYLFRNFHIPTPYLITTQFSIENTFTTTEIPYTNTFLTNISALNDKYRLSIINHLIANEELTLQKLSGLISLSNSATNHHLTLLKKANMISASRRGRTMFYSYNPNGFQDTINLLQQIWKGEQSQ